MRILGMTPRQLASSLRDIADKIDASRHPSRSMVATALKHTIMAAFDEPQMDLKSKHELEKKNKDMLKKTQDELGKKMEDLVKKGVAGDDITKAVGEMQREFDDMERKTSIR